jgi:sensor histidine kinase YesM
VLPIRRIVTALLIGWLVAAAVSTLAFAGAVAIGSVNIRGEFTPWDLLRTQATPWMGVALLTPLVVVFAARHPLSGPGRGLAWAEHLAAFLVFAAAHIFLNVLLVMAFNRQWPAMSTWFALGSRLMSNAISIMIQYALIVGVVEATRAHLEAQARARQALSLERDLAQARLSALQQQLRPHFLFNALNTVSALIEEQPATARTVLLRLSHLLRLSLARGHSGETSLGEELDFTDRYLSVEQARFGDRLAVHYSIADDTLGATVPAFLLQPLVENAVRHGFAQLPAGGAIDVGAERRADRLTLTVCNQAPVRAGFTEGVGLSQTRARLASLYGGRATLTAAQRSDGTFVVSVELPWRRS